jgi:hypothetical protein
MKASELSSVVISPWYFIKYIITRRVVRAPKNEGL